MKSLARPTAVALTAVLALASLAPTFAQSPYRPKLEVFVTGNPVPVVLQPAGGANAGSDQGTGNAGKDTCAYVYPSYLDTNFGNAEFAGVYTSNCNPIIGYGYLRFSLDGMPAANVESARISVYEVVMHSGTCGWPWDSDPLWSVRKVTADWDEMGLTWNNQPAIDETAMDSQTVAGVAGVWGADVRGWISFDITSLYQGWVSGTIPNYGVRISMDNSVCMNCVNGGFLTSDTTEGIVSLFADDFSDGSVGATDPHWDLKKGSWKVATLAGYPNGNLHKSSLAPESTVLVRPEAIQDGPFTAGTISLKLKVGGATSYANGNLLFDSTGPGTYRAVRLKQKSTGWFLLLVQKGAYDGDTERTVNSVKLTGFVKKHWHRLEVTVGSDGAVSAALADEEDSARSWTLNGAFAQNTGGEVGLMSRGTLLLVDDFELEAAVGR